MHHRIILAITITLAPMHAQAFQLSCKSIVFQSSPIAVDVDLANKTLTMEGGASGDITSVSGVEIVAKGNDPPVWGVTRRHRWELNRMTGHLTWHAWFIIGGHDDGTTEIHSYDCELAKPKF